MGIDPITHEHLSKDRSLQNETTLTTQPNNNIFPLSGDSIVNSSEGHNNSSSLLSPAGTEDENNMLGNICNDDTLIDSFWYDEIISDHHPLADPSWKCQPNYQGKLIDDLGLPSFVDNCSWILDSQDFGLDFLNSTCSTLP